MICYESLKEIIFFLSKEGCILCRKNLNLGTNEEEYKQNSEII